MTKIPIFKNADSISYKDYVGEIELSERLENKIDSSLVLSCCFVQNSDGSKKITHFFISRGDVHDA